MTGWRRLAAPSIVGVVVLASANLHGAPPSGELDHASRASVTVDSGRPLWPIVREPSGNWGVVGEAVARHAGTRAVSIRSVAFSVMGRRGRPLLERVFDTPEALSDILVVYAHGVSGGFVTKPAGSVDLNPGDVGVAFLAGLVSAAPLPRSALVTMEFTDGLRRSFVVELERFSPGQHMGWPLRLDSEPWVAANTAGTPGHWVGGALLTGRVLFIAQRFAIDLVQVDAAGETHPFATSTKESYYAWGEEVLSTGWGRVVSIENDARDMEVGETLPSSQHPAGNHVVIQHGPRLFSAYAHLQRGSVTVRVGDWVERGRALGLVGNSGNTTEPHLHIHFADRWRDSGDPLVGFFSSQGVPAVFWDATVLRGNATLPLRGATPLELDVIVAPLETP